MTTIPAGTTSSTARQTLLLLDTVLCLDSTSQEVAADMLGTVAESFRTHPDADARSRDAAVVLEQVCRLLRIAQADMAALEGI